MATASFPKAVRQPRAGLPTMVLLLLAVLSIMLYGDYLPRNILFSNDAPLGRLMAQCHHLPDRFTGCWEDLNLFGFRDWGASPSISYGLLLLLKPVWFAKLYAPFALLILGLGAWCFFRQSGFAPAACLLGGLATMLNSAYFSAVCWGMGSHAISIGMMFFALAALLNTSTRWRWLWVVVAGLAAGMGVTEGADLGALFSVYLGAFVLYQAWLVQGPWGRKLTLGLSRLGLVAVCAACLAAQAIFGLVATEIKGLAGTQQDSQTKEARWDWATQWSLPKRETLSLAVPGLFGYRMDTPNGGLYWGAVGSAPAWDRYFASGNQGRPPEGLLRHSGGGPYVGVSVLLIALWAATRSFRQKEPVFSRVQRKLLWFWLAAGFISLLLAYGRFAPFYRVIYALPYMSMVRNPVKFLHVVNFSLLVVFAYGIDDLWRRYLQPPAASNAPARGKPRAWWGRAPSFDKRWVLGCAVAFGASLLGWLAYASAGQSLERYLRAVQFDEANARAISAFSICQAGWFVLLLGLAAGLMLYVLRGAFAGVRAKWGVALLGVLLVADLGRADQPWIIYWDYKQKYTSNPIIDRLRERPYEHRVEMLPFSPPSKYALLGQLYQGEWLKHQFPYYNIQSLDVVQMPRTLADVAAYGNALSTTNPPDFLRFNIRAWQLTNARYLLGAAGFYPVLNRSANPACPPFRIVQRFDLVPRPGVATATNFEQLTAEPATDGPYALYEYTEALPRAKLYPNWQICTNDQAALNQLPPGGVDPKRLVLVAGGLPLALPAAGTNDNAGTVEFVSYAPKDILLKSRALSPSVLLLNDHFDLNWKVRVDGKPQPLLRCNYIMRGVYLEPGAHTIEFCFQPPRWPLYVSLSAIGVGVLVLGFLGVADRRGARSTCPQSVGDGFLVNQACQSLRST